MISISHCTVSSRQTLLLVDVAEKETTCNCQVVVVVDDDDDDDDDHGEGSA